MTQQIPDEFFWDDIPCRANTILPLPWFVVVDASPPAEGDGWLRSTACWRRYVARWAIRAGELWLVSIRGDVRLRFGDEPVRATWFTGVVRVLGERPAVTVRDEARLRRRRGALALEDDNLRARAEVLAAFRDSLRNPWAARGCREVDIRRGRVVRERRIDLPCDDDSPIWEELADDDRFGCKGRGYPLAGRPAADSFSDRRLRRACWKARTGRSLSPGAVAAMLGDSPRKAGRICEWENGTRGRPADWVKRYCALLSIADDDVDSMRRADADDAHAALEAWLSATIRPRLTLANEGAGERSFSYDAPPSIAAGDEAAAVAWARSCVALAWRPARLIVSRRRTLWVDGDGNVVDAPAGGDDAPPDAPTSPEEDP